MALLPVTVSQQTSAETSQSDPVQTPTNCRHLVNSSTPPWIFATGSFRSPFSKRCESEVCATVRKVNPGGGKHISNFLPYLEARVGTLIRPGLRRNEVVKAPSCTFAFAAQPLLFLAFFEGPQAITSTAATPGSQSVLDALLSTQEFTPIIHETKRLWCHHAKQLVWIAADPNPD
ncbi:hypothetical protein BC835DRAFT_99907 [Cytidiella melzeri]|nr:hypothetical protein BC835DRAFT_99907 [Cytidiella melzeri]